MSFAVVRGPGEPDQVCDAVAAAIVEEYVRRDPASQLNIRVSGGRGVLFVAGEIFSSADFDVAAVCRRVLGAYGVSAAMEPFVALEPFVPAWAPPVGSRECVTVVGYATSETPERLPKAVVLARDVARELEQHRSTDPEWFWLGADFTVTVNKKIVMIRAEHLESVAVADVRSRVSTLLVARHPDIEFKINPAGEETHAGLAWRVGSSGQTSAALQYGSALPSNASGVGRHPNHLLNRGAELARSAACELVDAGKGKAVRVEATWLPLEARPSSVMIRNERGEDLSGSIRLPRDESRGMIETLKK